MATYQRLTLQQRYLIESLYQQKKTQQHIARQLGVSQSTVSRELASQVKYRPHQPYQAQQAQLRAVGARKRTPYKLKGSLLTTVLTRLGDRLSPEQICGELERQATTRSLHYETVYHYIYHHQKTAHEQPVDHEDFTQYLRIRHRKHYKKRGKPTRRQLIPNRVSIEQRPAIVETNTEMGH